MFIYQQPPKPTGIEGLTNKLAGSEMLNKITELFSEADPRLNRLKESVLDDLQSLKQSPNLTSLAINMWKSAEVGLRKDLSELSVSDDKIETIIADAKKKWEMAIQPEQMKEILESPEKKALDNYITDVENLPVLTEIMKTAEPKKNWEIWLEKITSKIPGLSSIAGPILAFLGIKGKKADAIKKVLEKGKKEKPAPVAETETAEAAAKDEEKKVELASDEQEAVKPLQAAGFEMDLAKAKEDMDYLKGQKLDQEQIVALAEKSAKKESNLNKIKAQLGDTGVKFTLRDAYVLDGEYLQAGQISLIVENASKIKKDPDTARQFLDNAHKILKNSDRGQIEAVLELEKLSATA
jgi:hypothetical protein